MKKIYLLTDYKGYFESKHNAIQYRSGMYKGLLEKYFKENDFEVNFLRFSDINFRTMNFDNQYVLYTSQEDAGYHYKDYIEDIILGLQLQGAKLIPDYKYLRANNNKVFMEILRDQMNLDFIKDIKSHHFGTIEELQNKIDEFEFPVVIKSAGGAMSSGVYLAENKKDLVKQSNKISRTKYLYNELWDFGRSIKHKGYKRESKYRKKFIIQNFIPNLRNDWKILVFGERYYILYRQVKCHDFRASGSHIFKFNNDSLIPEGIFNYVEKVFNILNIPFLSLDVCFSEKTFYTTEFQALYFGKSTMEKSNGYFKKINGTWKKQFEILDLEKVYVDSIVKFINRK